MRSTADSTPHKSAVIARLPCSAPDRAAPRAAACSTRPLPTRPHPAALTSASPRLTINAGRIALSRRRIGLRQAEDLVSLLSKQTEHTTELCGIGDIARDLRGRSLARGNHLVEHPGRSDRSPLLAPRSCSALSRLLEWPCEALCPRVVAASSPARQSHLVRSLGTAVCFSGPAAPSVGTELAAGATSCH